jgi:hypothetical protein
MHFVLYVKTCTQMSAWSFILNRPYIGYISDKQFPGDTVILQFTSYFLRINLTFEFHKAPCFHYNAIHISLLISPIIPCCPVSADLLRFSQMPRTILFACDTISGVVFASVYFTNLFRTG